MKKETLHRTQKTMNHLRPKNQWQFCRAESQIKKHEPGLDLRQNSPSVAARRYRIKFGKLPRISHSKTLPLPGHHLVSTTLENSNSTRKYTSGKNHAVLRNRIHKRICTYMDLHMNRQQYNTQQNTTTIQYLEKEERTTVKCIILQTPAEHAEHGQIR